MRIFALRLQTTHPVIRQRRHQLGNQNTFQR